MQQIKPSRSWSMEAPNFCAALLAFSISSCPKHKQTNKVKEKEM
jgi:hypothetical protein